MLISSCGGGKTAVSALLANLRELAAPTMSHPLGGGTSAAVAARDCEEIKKVHRQPSVARARRRGVINMLFLVK